MFAGIVFGIMFGSFKTKMIARISKQIDWLILRIVAGFSYLIPVFVAGFIIKLQYDGVIQLIFKDYAAYLP